MRVGKLWRPTRGLWLLAPVAVIGLWTAAQPVLGEPAGQSEVSIRAPGSAPAAGMSGASIPTKNLWGIMREGGPLMIPIAGCSFLLLTFVFERLISLRKGRIIPKPFVTRFLQQMRDGELDRPQAMALCEESGSPVAEVFAGAVRKWGRPAVEVEQGIIDAGERVTHGLRRYLRLVNGIATISPLLGLLGTVTGIIRAFNAIAASDALGRPELLASGISEALLTTAAGLMVAIPALFFHLFLVSRVDRLIMQMDELSQEMVPLISAEEMSDHLKHPATVKPRGTRREAAA